MASKKIILVSHSPLLSGGAELSLLEIILFLNNNGWLIKVILPAEGEFSKRLEKEGIEYYIARYRWSVTATSNTKNTHKDIEVFNADSMIEAYKLMQEFNPDVVLTNTIVVPWFGYVAKALGIKHALIVSEMYNKQNNLRLLPNDEVYLRQLKNTVDFIFYNSDFTRSTYGDIFSNIENVVLYPVITIDKKYLDTHTDFNHKPLRLIVFGSIVRHKNQLEVLRAVLLLKKESFKLTIMGTVGGRLYYKKLKDFIKTNDLESVVTFLPYTKNPFLELIKQDVVIVPSLLEAFGRVTVEGQLLGRLVIGRATGGTRELITDSKTGLLYDKDSAEMLADKIKWIFKNTDQAKTIALEGQKWAIKNFIQTNSNDILEIQLAKLANEERNKKGDDHFNYVLALIERNIYVNGKIIEYDNALNQAIAEGQSLKRAVKQFAKRKLNSLRPKK
jgi:glycosyltransferase involved in cell wall biosynthesis